MSRVLGPGRCLCLPACRFRRYTPLRKSFRTEQSRERALYLHFKPSRPRRVTDELGQSPTVGCGHGIVVEIHIAIGLRP
jgi:hypothetical protein